MKHQFKALSRSPLANIGWREEFSDITSSDFLAGSWSLPEIVEQCQNSDVRHISLPFLESHPWRALERAGCTNSAELLSAFAYRCALLEETRHAFVPTGIKTTLAGLEKYRENYDIHGLGLDPGYLCSTELLEDANTWRVEDNLTRFQRLVLGSGYTFACLPSDGDSVVEPAYILLDNGDTLLGFAFNFYGK